MKLLVLLIALIVALRSTSCAADQTKPETGRLIELDTNKGVIKFALYEKDAPITTKNFVELVDRKFYDGLKFHRVVPGFVIQGGDPKGDGTGGSGKTIDLEVSSKLKHAAAGVVAMARSQHPNSASCQFYITLAAIPYLDMNYAVFGRVTDGLDVVKKIEVGDIMKTVRIISASGAEKSAPKPAGGSCCEKSDPKPSE
ncbi:MAG: peptidylprolyl isomerase [Armatimonadetes bacterium]|nr:peptidylprolyl isomerase [Armatimonadota bacterium]